jgi:hypothetical protein
MVKSSSGGWSLGANGARQPRRIGGDGGGPALREEGDAGCAAGDGGGRDEGKEILRVGR